MFGNNEVPFYEPSQEEHVRKLVIVGIVAAAMLGLGAALISAAGLLQPSSFQVETAGATQSSGVESDGDSSQGATSVFVHVMGSVVSPGVYSLPEGSRVYEAVQAAGGFSDDADEGSINLASTVVDGGQIRVLSMDEAEDVSGGEKSGVNAGSAGTVSGKININYATVDQLQDLDGIGPSTAQKIIAYRQSQGNFSSIDELTKVSGIGEKRLDAIRDRITV